MAMRISSTPCGSPFADSNNPTWRAVPPRSMSWPSDSSSSATEGRVWSSMQESLRRVRNCSETTEEKRILRP